MHVNTSTLSVHALIGLANLLLYSVTNWTMFSMLVRYLAFRLCPYAVFQALASTARASFSGSEGTKWMYMSSFMDGERST